jgi:hypothetical protein
VRQVTRRVAVQAVAASGLLALGGATWLVVTDGEADLYRRILTRLIGPFQMDGADFARFAADFTRAEGGPEGLETDLLRVGEMTGLMEQAARIDPATLARVQQFERILLTQFVLATGLRGPAEDRLLGYSGLFGTLPCSNPFARLA